MLEHELAGLRETGRKGDFLLPLDVCNTIMPDFYTAYPTHWHDEMEIVLIENGEMEETIDTEVYTVKTGDIIIVCPRALHSFRQLDESRVKFRTLMFDIGFLTANNSDACSIRYLNPFLEGCYLSPVVISPDMPHYEELKVVLENLIHSFDKKEKFFELQLRSYLYTLFFILFSFFFEREVYESGLKEATVRNIRIIIEYIQTNYRKQMTVEELAERIDLSKHYFMRFFKKYMGMTCIEYINDYRLNLAAKQLSTTNLQVTEIANSVGIFNLSYFNRIFKKKYHMTPKEYRANIDKKF